MLPARVDEHDKAARLGLAVLASWAAWPLGPAVFALPVGSGRVQDWREKVLCSPGRWSNLHRKAEGMASWSDAADSRSNGGTAANNCRTVELGHFKVQEKKFRTFLNRSCLAPSNEEFDKLVAGQRAAGAMRPSSSQPSS